MNTKNHPFHTDVTIIASQNVKQTKQIDKNMLIHSIRCRNYAGWCGNCLIMTFQVVIQVVVYYLPDGGWG